MALLHSVVLMAITLGTVQQASAAQTAGAFSCSNPEAVAQHDLLGNFINDKKAQISGPIHNALETLYSQFISYPDSGQFLPSGCPSFEAGGAALAGCYVQDKFQAFSAQLQAKENADTIYTSTQSELTSVETKLQTLAQSVVGGKPTPVQSQEAIDLVIQLSTAFLKQSQVVLPYGTSLIDQLEHTELAQSTDAEADATTRYAYEGVLNTFLTQEWYMAASVSTYIESVCAQ